MNGQSVYVIGAGVMGRGVAVSAALAGCRVVLVDRTDDVLSRSLAALPDEVRTYAIFSRDSSATPERILEKVTTTTDLGALAAADFVIENATEKWSVKKPIYERFDVVCQPGVVVAVNTSAIPITRLAALTARPDRVVGMHFMNPVPLKKTVELIRGEQTSEATLAEARGFLSRLGKSAILVNDSPGFVTNRVMMLTVNEAILLLDEGVSTAADIDRLFVQCFGHKMGPLETADLIGLDTVLLSLEVLYDSFGTEKYRPCQLLARMVEDGHLGRKSGRGFFTYRVPSGASHDHS